MILGMEAEGEKGREIADTELTEELFREIVQAADSEKIILFGSRARSESRAQSDLDILVIME